MPTFENGWICGKCWCANREFDTRCYRCHVDRPDEVGRLVVEEARKPPEAATEPILLTAPTAPKDEPAEVEATVSLAQESAPRRPGRHCIRCGHRLLDRAGFCTQCGTPAQDQPEVVAATEPILLTAPTAPKDEPAEVEATVSLAQESAPRRPGRHCIRCGHRLLDRAGFCTQCGTPAQDQPEVVAAPAPIAAQRVLPSPPSIRVPRFEMPRIRPQVVVQRLRQAMGTYLSQHQIGWEASMAGLAVAFVSLGFAGSRMSGAPIGWIEATQALITVAFVAEYLVRVAVVADRPAFVRGHLVELLAISPILRGLRVISLLWLVWLGPVARRLRARLARTHTPERGARRHWVLAVWALMLFTSAVATYGYGSSGGATGRESQFVVLVLIISIFGGLTASLSTTYLAARDPRLDQPAPSAAPTTGSAPTQHPAPSTGIAATGMNAVTPSHHG